MSIRSFAFLWHRAGQAVPATLARREGRPPTTRPPLVFQKPKSFEPLPPTECENCHHPVRDYAPVCAACGSPRGVVAHPRTETTNNGQYGAGRDGKISLPIKALCVYAASLAAAILLWRRQFGIVTLTPSVLSHILIISASNFGVSAWFALIPRAAGLLVAIAVLATRAYLQCGGFSSLRVL